MPKDFLEFSNDIKQSIFNNLKVATVGKIESYDHVLQKASVKINMQIKLDNGNIEDCPVVSNVPVIFPRSGGASITLPVAIGDSCLLLFSDRDLDNWKLGGEGIEPNTSRMHNLSDAVAIMGLNSFNTQSLAENNEDLLVIYSDSKIRFKPNGIIDIESAAEINIKTGKDIKIKSDDAINVECKSANIAATENIDVKCKNATMKVDNDVKIECNNANTTCDNAVITARQNISVSADGEINLNCKTGNVTASETLTITSPNLTHDGDMKITGTLNIEKEITSKGITNTGKITNTGEISSTAVISSDSDVVVKRILGQVSLKGHIHNVAAVPGFSDAPNSSLLGA